MRAAFLLLLAGCSAEVERGLDERKASEADRILRSAGIVPTLASGPGGISVRVSGGEAARALDALRAGRSPSQDEAPPSLLPTPTEDRARYERETAGALVTTLMRLPGIADARVHLAAPERDPLASDDAPAPRPRASVMIQSRGSAISADDVRRLVAGAVDGLEPASVAVVVAPAEKHAPVAPPPARGMPAAVLGVASLLVAALALALIFAIAYARLLREKLRAMNGRTS